MDEFEAIVHEEAIVPRLNALDSACEARGITQLGPQVGAGVAPLLRPPDAVVRALRADAKRREMEALRERLVEAERLVGRCRLTPG